VSRESDILDAAKELFYRSGYEAVAVDEIGQQAGLSGPSIYRYFDSKEEILATLFDRVFDRVLELMGPKRADCHDDLRALIRAQTTFARTERELLAIYTREQQALSKDSLRRLRHRQHQYTERWLESMERCFPNRARAVLISTTHVMMGLLLSSSDWPREVLAGDQLANLIEGLIWQGLGGLGPEDEPNAHLQPPAGRPAPEQRTTPIAG
jgi:AcrR family transcriptional regulator